MKLDLQVPVITPPQSQEYLGDLFGLIAERAERAGLSSLWIMDHFFPVAGPPEVQMLEGWSALAYAAGRTNWIKLGTMVTGITYRHPGILVKTATTLDVLSHGRAYFGIGAAWHEEEHLGLGSRFLPWPSALLAWKRRCRLPCRCEPVIRNHTLTSITSFSVRLILP